MGRAKIAKDSTVPYPVTTPVQIGDEMKGADQATSQNRRIKSIEVAFRVIRVLEAAEGFLPLVRVAALVGMPSSKVHIYLASMVREDLVMQDPTTRHYGLGQFSVQLGLTAIRNLDVVTAGRDAVDRLRDTTGCSVSLAIWGNRGPTIVLKADGDGQGSLGIRLGHVLAVSTSASGRVFMAYLSEREISEALQRERQPRDAALPAALKKILSEIRVNGYAISDRPSVGGRRAIAVPVFDFSDRLVASVAVLAEEGPVNTAVLEQIVATGKEISLLFGARDRANSLIAAGSFAELRLSDTSRKRAPRKKGDGLSDR